MKITLPLLEKYRKRKAAFQTVFRGPFGTDVLAYLGKFCGAFETTFVENDRQHARMEGRREVYLLIMKHLNFTTEELAAHFEAYMQVPN